MYVVYQHRRKDNNEIFYIGEGTLKRAYQDEKNRRNSLWIQTVQEAGGFEVDILAKGLTKEESLKLEAEYIKKYGTVKHGTGILVNERLSGTRGVESGYKHSEEALKKISDSKKGNTYNKGRKHSELSRLNISLGQRGKIMPISVREKIRDANKISQNTERMKRIKSETFKGIPKSEETKKRMRKPRSESAKKNMVYEKVKCPYCDKVGSGNSMKQWHFDRCKYNKNSY